MNDPLFREEGYILRNLPSRNLVDTCTARKEKEPEKENAENSKFLLLSPW